MKKILTLTAAAGLALTLAACSGESHDGVSEMEARLQCHESVKQQLSDPDGAEFQNDYDTMYWEIDGGYRVKSYVDAQNAFGGTIRYDWECSVKSTDSEDQYMVDLEYFEPAN